MKKIYLQLTFALFAILISVSTASTQNLIQNPDLEAYSFCPNNIGLVGWITSWSKIGGHSGSPDFIHTCATDARVQAPNNAFGSQSGHSGNSYIGFNIYSGAGTSYREYVTTTLSSPLSAGTNYTLSFWVSLSDNSMWETDGLQILFTNSPASGPGSGTAPLFPLHTPQINNTYKLTDQTNWVQLSFVYAASGGEQYMTLGNFYTDASTSATAVAGSINYSYWYFDDFSLIPGGVLPLKAELAGTAQSGYNALQLTNNLKDIDHFDIERSSNLSEGFEKIASIPIDEMDKAENGDLLYHDESILSHMDYTYRIKSVDDRNGARVSNSISLQSLNEQFDVLLYPNPAVNSSTLEIYSNEEGNTKVEILDMLGKTVLNQSIMVNDGITSTVIDTDKMERGTYIVSITNNHNESIKQKLVLR